MWLLQVVRNSGQYGSFKNVVYPDDGIFTLFQFQEKLTYARLKPMIKTFTLTGKWMILLAIFSFFSSFCSQAQPVAPKIIFRQPQLVSGIDGQKEATYKFTNVIPGVDAFVKIENIVNGASLGKY